MGGRDLAEVKIGPAIHDKTRRDYKNIFSPTFLFLDFEQFRKI